MPQITLECSKNIDNIDPIAVFKDIHNVLKDITDIRTCKSRLRTFERFLIGKGEPENALIHLKVELLDLPNRTPELRKIIAEKLVNVLEKHYGARLKELGLNCKPTVHIEKLKVYAISSSLFSSTAHQPETIMAAITPRIAPYARL
jgi:5-carboxymethyl-2-hydroxymuconate isomerase